MRTLLGIVFGAALLFVGGAGCESEPEPLPNDLIQVWRNPAPGYKDHYFEIREGWLLFGTDDFTFTMFPLETVRSKPLKNATEFTLEYRDDEGEAVPVYLVYTPGTPGKPPHLRIGARDHLWVPERFALWRKKEVGS